MSMRYQAGILTASYFPLKVPNAPTGATATSLTSTTASVTFTAPTDIGGGAITSYTVVSSSGQIGTGASSPVTVSGLTAGVAYTFVVYANNAFGNSPASASSNSVTPAVAGQQAYTTAGTYSWVAPAGVTSVSAVAVGGGGGGSNSGTGGAGGGLGYKNNISVTPGNSYTVRVGAAGPGGNSNSEGGDSYFINTSTVKGGGGRLGAAGLYTGDGGGNGGYWAGVGGGAGGYSGTGGSGLGGSPSGGAGGGGSYSGLTGHGAGGGGVGLLGQGSTGANGTPANSATENELMNGGQGGSGGSNGSPTDNTFYDGSSYEPRPGGAGGAYGGGGGSGWITAGGSGAVGAVRIIWPGTTRSFPSTNTGNL